MLEAEKNPAALGTLKQLFEKSSVDNDDLGFLQRVFKTNILSFNIAEIMRKTRQATAPASVNEVKKLLEALQQQLTTKEKNFFDNRSD